MRDAVDFMSAPDPALLKQLNLDALPYTGNARPDPFWFAAMRDAGLPVLTMIRESYSTRSQEGEQAGIDDCTLAEARAKEVNPDVLSMAVVVSDGSWSDTWDCSAYGRGWAKVATLRFFPYGATECCTSFIRGALGINQLCIDGEWIPETWGTGRLMTQVVGPSPVPDSDLNHVHGDYTGGATTPVEGDDDVLYMVDKDGIHWWRMGDSKRKLTGAEMTAAKLGGAKASPFDQAWHDSVPDPPVNAGDLYNIGETIKQVIPPGTPGTPTKFTVTSEVTAT